MEAYKTALLITTLKKNEEGTELILDLPFRTYAQNIVSLGDDITYRLNDLSNDGVEVLAKVDYRLEDLEGTAIKGESVVAEAFSGNMGQDWSVIQKDTRYTKHYNVKKSEALATFDAEGNKTLYNGSDKDDVTKFTQWETQE